MYEIRWDQAARDDVKRMKLRAYDVGQIVAVVDRQLTQDAEDDSRSRKLIRPEEQLPFEHLQPVWQLRVGEFRVYYDVSREMGPEPENAQEAEEPAGVVRIRAVRRKPTHKTT